MRAATLMRVYKTPPEMWTSNSALTTFEDLYIVRNRATADWSRHAGPKERLSCDADKRQRRLEDELAE